MGTTLRSGYDRPMRHRLILVGLAFLTAHANGADHPACVGIAGGDTLAVLTAETRQVAVRLCGVDAPESPSTSAHAPGRPRPSWRSGMR